jgi:hypothetical protein
MEVQLNFEEIDPGVSLKLISVPLVKQDSGPLISTFQVLGQILQAATLAALIS